MSFVKFISGDGVEHEVEETSLAADIMRQNGFQLVGGEATAPVETATPAPTRADIVARAKELGLTFKGNAKNADIQALIDAKLAETPEPVMVKFVLADQSIVEAVEGSEEFVALSNDHDVKRLYSDEDALAQNDGVDASTGDAE